MNCNVMPWKRYQEISYRIKCVDVESERVFGDVYVTQQTRAADCYAYGYPFPSVPRKRRSNLIQRTLQGPDFMELNRRCPAKRNSFAEPCASRATGKRSKSVGDRVTAFEFDRASRKTSTDQIIRTPKVYPAPLLTSTEKKEAAVASLVDQLLMDIYGLPAGERGRSESDSTASSLRPCPRHQHLQKARLLLKSEDELRVMLLNLRRHINHTGGLLVRQLRRKDYLAIKRDKQCDIITAHLQAYSVKRVEDTKMRFSLTPQPGESGFTQWLDAMKMVARLQGGIPPEFRKRLWLTLAERHLEQRGVDWKQAEKVCFNEWSNPDDEELGIQIVKDLHRTGCSLFCGAAGRDNQAVLRRVLLGFARWNKSVGYCQGLNVLAALVLQVMDRAESAAVKVMIYLIEGVLPEGYFADNLRGLSVDMAVFRDLLRSRLPKLSKHLEALQSDAKDKATSSSYEPPLTNVFTMQWFLTLFCHCLPQEAVLRVWDLIFLEGDEILLRTALAIWEGLSDRIMTVTSADEFYSIMGVLTREMLEFTDTNNLIKNIVTMGPLHGVTGLREKHRYNITPWARKLSDDDDSDTEEDERLAVAAAMFSMAQRLKKDRLPSTMGALQAMAPSSDRERLALDISTLKQHYAKLRERQRQAHIILSAACARQSMVPPPTSQAMNHLLVGKNALVTGKNRPLSLPSGTAAQKTRPTTVHSPRSQSRKDKQGITLHWKDTKKPKQKPAGSTDTATTSVSPQSPQETSDDLTSPKRTSTDSDSDSTSTELCDEPDRLSDLDSEELTSASDSYVMATDEDKKSPRTEGSPVPEIATDRSFAEEKPEAIGAIADVQKDSPPEVMQALGEISIAKITDQIRRLSAEDDNNMVVPHVTKLYNEKPPDDVPVKESLGDKDNGSAESASSYASSESIIRKSLEANSQKEETTEESSMDYIMDANILRKSLVLDDFDYLSYNSTVNTRKDEVLVHERHKPKETRGETGETEARGTKLLSKEGKLGESVTTERKRDTDEFSKYSSISPGTKFEKDVLTLDTSKERKPQETPFVFSNSVSKTTEDSNKLNNLTSSPPSEVPKRNLYPKTYVGHLPISPITVDQKVSKLAHGVNSLLPGSSQEPDAAPEAKLETARFAGKTTRMQTKLYAEEKSPKTPESGKSFSSGETMGPDSRPSSLTVSPRTPIRSESKDKSLCSSVSSESKTLVLHSLDSDVTKDSPRTETRKTSYEKSNTSTPLSTDSLKNKSDSSPKLVISNSSDSCSPSKLKSSERSFSSDLQSPISANSIRYTSNYDKRGQDDASQSSTDLNAVTSPFYPIANPSRKTPSPYDTVKQRSSAENNEKLAACDGKSAGSKDLSTFLGYRQCSSKSVDTRDIGSYIYVKPQFSASKDNLSGNLGEAGNYGNDFGFYHSSSSDYYQKNKDYDDDPSSEKDVVPSLPQEKIDKQYMAYNYRRTRHLERSSSSLESRFSELKSSTSTDEFATSVVKKRSSDILEDIKHLEAKTMSDGKPDTSMLSKKTSYMWEDLKNLEARRQDTFSNSASNFSKRRLEIPEVNVVGEGRKSYVVHPKINIDENSDSILGIVTRSKKEDAADDERESKIGVWTKVKPGKNGNNGRRSSERALKIIQENSVILHKILACQSRKRLSDLEEISKEITISPINEEISKIFSPILEKIGLNEDEINEELARIKLKDLDSCMSATTVSEFGAKINHELSKLSLTDDVDQIDVDEIMSDDYLDTREALIDRKINEELAKLLANYEESSPPSAANHENRPSSQNVSDTEGLDLTSISTNVFSYKSSNDSIETRSELGSINHEPTITAEKYPQFTENILPFATSKYEDQNLSPKSDIDIHRELEKLEKISSAQVLPDPSLEMPQKELSPISSSYIPNVSPYVEISPLRYATGKPYDSSPLNNSSYEPYKSFDFKRKLSPRKSSSNPYTTVPFEKPAIETTFDFMEHKSVTQNAYSLHLKSPILSKESLEFRVRYDDESPRQLGREYLSRHATDGKSIMNANKEVSSYYGENGNKPITPTKYASKEERRIESTGSGYLEYPGEASELLRRKYDPLSPKEYSHGTEYGKHLGGLPPVETGSDIGTYLPTREPDYQPLSPNRQITDHHFRPTINHYASKLSPGVGDETKRPVSHPEYPGKLNVGKYVELPEKGTSCYKKSSLSLGNIGHSNRTIEEEYSTFASPSPKTHFSPFPVRNAPRKPKELTLKLGLYSPNSTDLGQSKRS